MKLVLLGRIVDAHGIRGAVKLKSIATNPTDIAAYGPLQTESGEIIEILRMKLANDVFIADLKGVKDRNQAEALKGTELFVSRDKLPAAKDSEVYLYDLIGLTVTQAGVALGKLTQFQNFGAGELLELESGLLIPALFITSTGDNIEVNLPDGYLDDEKPEGATPKQPKKSKPVPTATIDEV